MALYKHPISHYWVTHILVPFLLYAFASRLPYPAEISQQVQRSIDFCLQKPDHPSDGDDLVFERVFMAIMHRHKNPAPDLDIVVEHLEPLAKYLIRRAQLKGPYELLERPDVGSNAWIEYEQRRLGNLMIEPTEVEFGMLSAEERKFSQPDRVPELIAPRQPPMSPVKPPPTDSDIDPRLIHAHQGFFTGIYLPKQLTKDEDSYYRRQNRDIEEYIMRKQQQPIHTPAVPFHKSNSSYDISGSTRTDVPSSNRYIYQQQPWQQSNKQLTATHQRTGQQVQLDPQWDSQWLSQQRHSQPQLTPPNAPMDAVFEQSSFVQQATPQAQPAPQQIYTQRVYPFRPHSHAQQIQPPLSSTVYSPLNAYSPPAHLPSPQNISPPSHATPTAPQHSPIHTPLSTQLQAGVPSSDFAHLRSTDWSLAAEQRAREFAASITSQERDDLAQRIMQRQQTIALQSPGSGAKEKGSVVSPTARWLRAPLGSEAVGYGLGNGMEGNGASVPPGLPSQHGSRMQQRGWEMGLPTLNAGTDHGASGSNIKGERIGLPTLEQVRSRSRYYLSRQQSHTAAPGMAPLGSQVYGGSRGQAVPVNGHNSGYAFEQQIPPLPAMTGWRDALQQLRFAASQGRAGGDVAKSEDENGDAKMSGI